jgi:hypothetical protein
MKTSAPTACSFVFLAVVATACATTGPTPPPLAPVITRGPAAGARPTKVLALPARCSAIEFRCPQDYADAVDNIVRGNLEFAGYPLVAPETLRAVTRSRQERLTHDRTTNTSSGVTTVEHAIPIANRKVTTNGKSETTVDQQEIVLDGPGFDDLPPLERQELMKQAAADAVVVTRIVVGSSQVEVMVKLGVGPDDGMAWASRCAAPAADPAAVSRALEDAARCAMVAAGQPSRP